MSLSVRDFFYTQLFLKIPQPTASFDSKTVIVTGANSGLGKEAVKHIVALGASKVIIACRDTTKGNAAKAAIASSLKCSPDILEVWKLDLESYSSVKEFAAWSNKLPRLDALINNAGIQTLNFHVVDGTERTIAVNVIGTFLLALMLLPKLKETAKAYQVTPHLTFVTSALYSMAKYPEQPGEDIFAWLGDKNNVNMMNEYNLSKLLQVLVIRKLASIVDPTTDDKSTDSSCIVINCLDPCFCRTGLARDLSPGLKFFFRVFAALFARTAEEGSRLVVITASAGRKTHGGYMRGGSLKNYPPLIASKDGAEKAGYLWEQLGRKLEEIQPGILANVNTV